jgi:hypothetical protein
MLALRIGLPVGSPARCRYKRDEKLENVKILFLFSDQLKITS